MVWTWHFSGVQGLATRNISNNSFQQCLSKSYARNRLAEMCGKVGISTQGVLCNLCGQAQAERNLLRKTRGLPLRPGSGTHPRQNGCFLVNYDPYSGPSRGPCDF